MDTLIHCYYYCNHHHHHHHRHRAAVKKFRSNESENIVGLCILYLKKKHIQSENGVGEDNVLRLCSCVLMFALMFILQKCALYYSSCAYLFLLMYLSRLFHISSFPCHSCYFALHKIVSLLIFAVYFALIVLWRKIFRRIYGPKYENGEWKSRKNRELEEISKGENIVKWIKGQRISWLGHLERMEEDRMSKKIFTQELEGTRRRRRPMKGWK